MTAQPWPIARGKRESGSKHHDNLVQEISLDCLRVDDSPRLNVVDVSHLERLAECDGTLPPIVVHRQTMRVIDGIHRWHVAAQSGNEVIPVQFFDGSDEEAFALSVELNVKHGLPLTLGERKNAALHMIAAGSKLSDRAIAAKVGLSNKTVTAIRLSSREEVPHLNSRVGSDGRLYPVNANEGRRRAAELATKHPDASLREIARATGVSLGTASDVRKRLAAGQDPIATGRVPRQGRRSAARESATREIAAEASHQSSLPRPDKSRREMVGSTSKKSILDRLHVDPSIRSKARARDVVRWLAFHSLDMGELPDAANVIPPHQYANIAKLARMTASVWTELALRLESMDGS